MMPDSFEKCIAVLLGVSLAIEAAVISGFAKLPVGVYHPIHLLLMAGLLLGVLLLYRQRRATRAPDAPVALLFAVGLAFTAVGDYVNSPLSGIEPVTTKLTWALLLFGLGYSCYVAGMWKGLSLLGGPGWRGRLLWLIPLILVGNVATWFRYVSGLVADHPLLYYGSFVFNATLYVVLPWLAIRYLIMSRFALGAVVVMVGAVFVAYSDLVLFTTWLVQPAGEPITAVLYASNWLVYFGGQCLVNVFTPSLAAALGAPARSYSTAVP